MPGDRWIPPQRASNTENVSMSWYLCGTAIYPCYTSGGIVVVTHKNTERHTADSIVSWPNQHWQMLHTYDLITITWWNTRILSIITREMGKLNTLSPIYCMKYSWENWLNLKHIINRMLYMYNHFLSSIHVLSDTSAYVSCHWFRQGLLCSLHQAIITWWNVEISPITQHHIQEPTPRVFNV